MKKNVISSIIILATSIFFTFTMGCDSVSTRTMSIPVDTISTKTVSDKAKIIDIVKGVVTAIANKHGFTEDDLVAYKAFVPDRTKYLLHRVRIIKRPVEMNVVDHISIILEDNKFLEICVYRMNSVDPPSDLDPVFADILFECGKKLELYPVTFKHDKSNIILGMGLIDNSIHN